jgi:hypothetical protein
MPPMPARTSRRRSRRRCSCPASACCSIVSPDQARLAGDHEAEVVMLGALALRVAERGQLAAAQQLLATADDAALAAVNIVDEVDRLDAHRARELISGERQALSAPSPGGQDRRGHLPPGLRGFRSTIICGRHDRLRHPLTDIRRDVV